MKRVLFVLLTLFVGQWAFPQTHYENYWDGAVYFKLQNDCQWKIPSYEKSTQYVDELAFLNEMVSKYDVFKLKSPFRTKDYRVERIYRVDFANFSQVDNLIRDLQNIPQVEWAQKSPILKLFVIPNDPKIGQQYYLEKINAYEAWDLTTGSKDVKIAIVDDAFKISHPDLADNVWINEAEIAGNGIDDDGNGYIDDINGWDAADEDNDPSPPDSPGFWGEMVYTHGTHCAGIAAGVTGNGIGIASVSHNVSFIPIKALSNNALIPLAIEKPAEGIDYAIAAGAHIVSMSFGGEQADGFGPLETLINAGTEQGIIFVAAAGNNGDGSGSFLPGAEANAINYPAGFDNVLAVGATNAQDKKPGFSQYGEWLDVMAPGEGIYSSLAWSEEYGDQDGTSMACPMVAGALALMKSYKPEASPEELIICLKNGCDNIDEHNAEFVGKMGAGRINVYNSLLCLDEQLKVEKNEIEFAVYPNPAINELNFKFSDWQNRTVKIVNISGQVVMTYNPNQAQFKADVSGLSSGLYMIVVSEGDNVALTKINIQR
ncbi:MAG: S8 family serine peptidase [Bacteroidales bacterium]|jgi:subtilisin family serine protease|nr:S8 family serine peptidase [Bacteroidales bacterium]